MKRSNITDKDVCQAVENYWLKQFKVEFPYQELAKEFKCDEKLAYSACERAVENGLIEYGVSLRTGWLTEKGKELLK